MNNNLILIGGGGHCKSVIEVVESAGYHILGILDRPSEMGKDVLGYKIIGTDDEIPNFIDNAQFLVTVGQIKSADIRIKLHQLVKNAGGTFAIVIASTAHVSQYAQIGEGTVVMHKAFINANAQIGKGCILNTMCNIEHDAIIGDYCHISTGAMVNGSVTIGANCFIGSQSVVANNISICDNVVVAAGAVILKNITKPGIYIGNPAKYIKNDE